MPERADSFEYLLFRPLASPRPRLRSELWQVPLERSLMVRFPWSDSETCASPKVWPRSWVMVLSTSYRPLQERACGRVVQLKSALLSIMSDHLTRSLLGPPSGVVTVQVTASARSGNVPKETTVSLSLPLQLPPVPSWAVALVEPW